MPVWGALISGGRVGNRRELWLVVTTQTIPASFFPQDGAQSPRGFWTEKLDKEKLERPLCNTKFSKHNREEIERFRLVAR